MVLFGRAEVLPYFITELQNAGYQLVSLEECTGLPAYQAIAGPQIRDVRRFPSLSIFVMFDGG